MISLLLTLILSFTSDLCHNKDIILILGYNYNLVALGNYLLVLIKFLDGMVVAKKPYLMQTVRLTLRLEHPTCIEVLICIYNLTNDETFHLWDTFN